MRSHLCSSLEILEDRIAPAALLALHPNYIKYLDKAGDQVTVTFSKSFINSANVNSIFTFQADGAGQDLVSIDLTHAPSEAALSGMNISVTVHKEPGGTGITSVGSINAPGVDLGAIRVVGDLGSINVGAANAYKNAVRSITVDTLGANANAVSNIAGILPRLTVTGAPGVTNSLGDTLSISGALTSAGIRGDMTGSIIAAGNITKLAITGSVLGGADSYTGYISSTLGEIGTVTIGGSLDGSATTGGYGGAIISSTGIKALTVNGNVTGGAGNDTGFIQADFGVGAVKIGQNLVGGSGSYAGAIEARTSLASVSVGQNIEAGATVRAGSQIGAISVKGSIEGTQAQPVIFSAQGVVNTKAKTDVAITSLDVTENMEYAVVLAGYNTDMRDTGLSAVDPNAQIGAVTVGGNFVASDLVAGVQGTMNGNSFVFGTAADAAFSGGVLPGLVSKIASVTIHGTVTGDSVSGASYGITAQYVDAVKVGSMVETLLAGANNDLFSTGHEISLASNVTIDEVAS